MNKTRFLFTALLFITACSSKHGTLVFQTDFGLKDGAVSAMKGVAHGIDAGLQLYDLTNEIPAYNVWEAAYRLNQTAPFWPAGTVFVSVVDPGVGTQRRSVVVKTKSGHYFVTPDNGTLTLIAETLGLEAVRTIDEKEGRRPGSTASYTFHGRDVYAYTAAKLAAGEIRFEEIGPVLNPDSLVRLPYQRATLKNGVINGGIPVLDLPYGNVWTNVPDSLFRKLNITTGDSISVKIFESGASVYQGVVPFAHTFGAVPPGKPLAYLNSLMNFSLALNQGAFADSFRVRSGNNWRIEIQKQPAKP